MEVISFNLVQFNLRWRVVQAHWEQLEEMETLSHKEGTLLYQQPDMVRKTQKQIS